MLEIAALLRGMGLGASLIIAIGAQNAFVLRQGILRQQVLTAVLVCSLCDILLISAGILGMGELITAHPSVAAFARWAGAAFLFAYGLRAARQAFANKISGLEANASGPARSVLMTAFAFSLLNPHVYLDTVVLLGSIGASEGARKLWFGFGAICASLIWFFSLGFGARLLGPLFQRPIAWRILDGLIALTMWTLAVTLIV